MFTPIYRISLWCLMAGSCSFAEAADYVWTGMISNEWAGGLNWSPVGTPGDADTATVDIIQNTPVVLTSDVAFGANLAGGIDGLTVANGASLSTNSFFLHVDGGGGVTTVSGAASRLSVEVLGIAPSDFALDTDSLDILLGGTLELNGGHVDVDSHVEIDSTSQLIGYGDVFMGSTGSTTVLDNRGTIEVDAVFNGGTGELTLHTLASAANASLDLDGSDEGGQLLVNDNSALPLQQSSLTLRVEAPLSDGFSGLLDIGANDTAHFTNDWLLEAGTIELSGGVAPATLSGGKVTNAGGLVEVSGRGRIEGDVGMSIGSQVLVMPDATLTLTGEYTASGSTREMTVNQNATVQFDGAGVIENGAELSFGNGSHLVVNGDLTVDRVGSSFDWDGSADDTQTSVTGSLSVAADSFDANGFSGMLRIDGGQVSVDVPGFWIMRGTLSMTATAVNTSHLESLSDSTVFFEGTTIQVGGNGTSSIRGVDNRFDDAVSVSVGSDATLQIQRPVVNGGTWTGRGALELVDLDVVGSTTMSVDTVIPQGTLEIHDDLILQVHRVDTSGNGDTIHGPIVISDTGSLTVAFNDPHKSWVLPVGSTMQLEGRVLGNSPHLEGSDMRLEGDVTVTGHSVWHSRFTLSGNVDIDPAGSVSAWTFGPNNHNRMAGGEIRGGKLTLISNSGGVIGFGVIDAVVNSFVDAGPVLADDGVLTIRQDGDFVLVGTADHDGVLNFEIAFDTANAEEALQLNGGATVGAAITNGRLTRGHGSIQSNAFQQNLGGKLAALGGELIVDVVSPTIDVASGFLEALGGNLTFADPLSGDFQGMAAVGSGRRLDFQQGWTLGAGGRLTFQGDNLIAPQVGGVSLLRGAAGNAATVNVTGGLFSSAEFVDYVTFGTNSAVHLPDAAAELRLLAGGVIEGTPADQTAFSGDGSLVNRSGSELTIADDLLVGVHLRNDGNLVLGSSIGVMDVTRNFTNSSAGSLEIDLLSSPGGTDQDQIDVTGDASLAGTLELIMSGTTPAYGNEFVILTAASVSGVFDTVLGLDTISDRYFAVVYDTTEVRTIVALPGDANLDGTVDGSDFNIWNAAKFTGGTSWTTGDFNGDGATDGTDFGIWNSFKFTSAGTSATVPEPATPVWLYTLGIACRRRWRMRHQQRGDRMTEPDDALWRTVSGKGMDSPSGKVVA